MSNLTKRKLSSILAKRDIKPIWRLSKRYFERVSQSTKQGLITYSKFDYSLKANPAATRTLSDERSKLPLDPGELVFIV